MKRTLILAVAAACLIGLLGGSLVAATGGKQPGTYQVIEVKGAATSGAKEYLTILLEVESGDTWLLNKKKFTWEPLSYMDDTAVDIPDEQKFPLLWSVEWARLDDAPCVHAMSSGATDSNVVLFNGDAGKLLLFKAGEGEWFNQPVTSWDMTDDAVDRPPSEWQLALTDVLGSQEDDIALVIVDFTEMDGLIAQDFGFLVNLHKKLKGEGVRIILVGRERIMDLLRLTNLDKVLKGYPAVGDALTAEGAKPEGKP